MLVKDELERLEISYEDIQLGEVELLSKIAPEKFLQLQSNLIKNGMELIIDRKSVLAERVKNLIFETVHLAEELPKENYSYYISSKLNQNYTYLANIFSETQGITIEHYIIQQKIEKVKQLLLYDELSLTQISYRLNYSSVAHLSNQFKKVTGITPSAFKQQQQKLRSTLENFQQ
jgi:AraC-like DNA-binding protein